MNSGFVDDTVISAERNIFYLKFHDLLSRKYVSPKFEREIKNNIPMCTPLCQRTNNQTI